MGTDALPIVIDSGRKKERDLDSLPEDTIIASVLSLLKSLSLFTVIRVLTYSIPALMHREEEIWDLMRGRRFLELRVIGV